MSYRLKSILAASLLPLAACTPPPEDRSSFGGAVVLDPSSSYGGSYQPSYGSPVYGGGYADPYRAGYGGSCRSSVVYGQVIGADRVGGGGGGGNDLAGAAIGGIAGGLVGNQIGGGSGRDIATAVGAIGGALAGREIAQQRSEPSRVRWTIRLDDGQVVRIVQNVSLGIGQRVAVSWRNGNPVIVG